MSEPPADAKIYHITHVENLARIRARGELLCDRRVVAEGGPAQVIGMSEIKRRRIEELGVTCHPGTKVGDYVPFYFCPRSVMLYVIHMANHPALTYRGGQGPIVHLEADLRAAIRWAEENDRRWAFSLSNAGAYYTEFRSREEQLDQLEWAGIAATDFRPPEIKERKQAEFLMHDTFPLELVELVAVHSETVRTQASDALATLASPPPVQVRRDWYF
jgi:hypothetical protein